MTPPVPPQPLRPCDLPYQEKAGSLPAQADLTTDLDGSGWVELEKQDAAAYNGLFPQFNANVDWSAAHCVAKPAPLIPSK